MDLDFIISVLPDLDLSW